MQRADELNKRIIPVLRRSVDGLPIPDALERPNWVFARPEDDFETSVTSLIDALELDEAWVEQHARLTQRTGEWLRHDRDGSYLLRGSDLRSAESWLDDQDGAPRGADGRADHVHHREPACSGAAPAVTPRQASGWRSLITAVLAVVALVAAARKRLTASRRRGRRRSQRSRSPRCRGTPRQSVRDALAAVDVRSNEPEALYALRKAVSTAGWTSILRLPGSRRVPQNDVEFSRDGSRVVTASSDGRVAVWDTRSGRRRVTIVNRGGAVDTVQFSPDGRQLLTASEDGIARTWDSSTGRLLHEFDTTSDDESELTATWGASGRRILTAGSNGGRGLGRRTWDAPLPAPKCERRPADQQDEPERAAGAHGRRGRERAALEPRDWCKADDTPGQGDRCFAVLAAQQRRTTGRDVLLQWQVLRLARRPRAITPLRPRREGRPRRGLQP